MLGHGRWRFPAHAPIDQHRRPRAGPTNSAKAESDRVAYFCPSATVQICNPRMSRAALPELASAWRQSSLEPANARRPAGSRIGLTRCYPTSESDRFRARMATPFQERSPCQTASYPRVRRAFTGNAPCSALSYWRLTTSGFIFSQPRQEVIQPLIDVVNVVGSDSH